MPLYETESISPLIPPPPVSECIQKFGEKDGQEVWEATNRAFDAMPIAAVIDKKVFACVLVTVRVYWYGGVMVGEGYTGGKG